jgi:branched-chain amino acid transport system permease protein
LLIGVSIGMQRGLWGLGESAWRRVFRKRPIAKDAPHAPVAQGEKA